MDEIKKKWLPRIIISKTSEFDSNWNEYQTALKTQTDVKAYEDALTKEVRRRVELVKKNK
jgi:putative aldouronate transport system substrate-binding protein